MYSTIEYNDIRYHLVGAKKVQQVWARAGVLEKFFPDEPESVALLRSAFAGLYSLSSRVLSISLY